ncbi:thiamine biosynthesis lipoprotein [Deinococcus sp. HSC-46F16]|uniref:FAD:protein FMN transferase n=1 Tax=Deinococcus sp. HSC-46F16 TaxID=2910968 RepID=UPI0020A0CDBB|nr:FAD:protein FMN transferase [Deinococcus sp. HSC-46F16]MCP2013866.1 thiamine biosynthesis lipoprotein [Deinococcus sp. HSC-46F16]
MFRRPYRLRSVYERMLGTELELQIVAGTRPQAEAAERAALDEVDRLAGVLNRFDPASEFSRWAATEEHPLPLSPELRHVLVQADLWRERSGGAFHPGADALGALWAEAAARDQRPDPQALADVAAALRSPLWTLHPDGTATRHGTLPVGLNALAKGFVVDRAAEAAFRAPGVRAALVNVGGDLRTLGGRGLRVAVADPFTPRDDAPPLAWVRVRDGALATSGGAHRGYRIGPAWYSHLLDPRSGQPVSAVPGVTVTAPSCLTADALATALSVLDVGRGLALADATPGAAALVVTREGKRHASGRWGKG